MSLTIFPINDSRSPIRSTDGVNMCNRNAAIVLGELGFAWSQDPVPINEFVRICQQWLRVNLNKPSSRIDDVTSGNSTNFGIPEGYVNGRVHELAVMAEKAKDGGATAITWD